MKKDFFADRRTVRNYSGEEIPEELLRSILERAMRAPTTGNMQLYTVIVTRDADMKKALAPAHFNQSSVEGCSVMLTVCADFNRFTRWCELRKADAGFDNMLSFVSAMSDALIVAQQIVAIAESEGLGTCYLGTVTYNADKISEILELPELVVPVACITLGYPGEMPEQCERLPLEAVVHEEKYRADSDGEILELFRSKEEFPQNDVYVKENGKENLAQVFAEVRYPRSMNETFSETFLKLLRDKRFMR